MAKHHKAIALAVILPILTGCEGTTGPTPTASPAPTVVPAANTPAVETVPPPPLSGSGGGVIAFSSARDGDSEIYLMNADGSDQRRLTARAGLEEDSAWSPDGARIAFCGHDDTDTQSIWVINADGSGLQRLTKHGGVWDFEPTWSPDGSRIAFTSNRDDNFELYVMATLGGPGADGSNQHRLTDSTGEGGHCLNPAWSPDGTQLAFVSNRDGDDEIFVMQITEGSGAVDGSIRQLTHNDANDWWPAWSPDGLRITFSSNRDGDYEIYTMDVDGSDPWQLTVNDIDDWWPAWSPDGSRIAFASGSYGRMDIYVATIADEGEGGTLDLQRLTDDGTSSQPSWRP